MISQATSHMVVAGDKNQPRVHFQKAEQSVLAWFHTEALAVPVLSQTGLGRVCGAAVLGALRHCVTLQLASMSHLKGPGFKHRAWSQACVAKEAWSSICREQTSC